MVTFEAQRDLVAGGVVGDVPFGDQCSGVVDQRHVVVGPARSEVPGFLPVRFSAPPPEPDVRVGPACGSPQAPLSWCSPQLVALGQRTGWSSLEGVSRGDYRSRVEQDNAPVSWPPSTVAKAAAALDLPRALVEWVPKLGVTRLGDQRCKLRPSQHAVVALVSARTHHAGEESLPGSGSVSPPPMPAPARSSTCSPNVRRVCSRSCAKPRWTSPCWTALSPSTWLSPALPGRAHDLTAARTHRICQRQGVPILADLACQAAAPGVVPASKAGPCRNSPSPRRLSTGPWLRHEHRSNSASRA